MISNISQTKALGIFDDCPHFVAEPEFRKFNLIYGFNGTGKTTLSRMFRSLELGRRDGQLPDNCEFEICVDGDRIPIDQLATNKWRDRVLVFNRDFVEENIEWIGGTLRPIYYIGKDQAGFAKILEALQRGEGRRGAELKERGRAAERSDTMLRNFKRQTAALIAEELGLGRRYDARNLDRDYGNFVPNAAKSVSEEGRKACRNTINRDSPGSSVNVPPFRAQIINLWEAVSKVPSGSVGTQILHNLVGHERMLGWVREGFHYHMTSELATCLFCANEVGPERLRELAATFDRTFETFHGDCERLLSDLQDEYVRIIDFVSNLPGKEAFGEDLQADAGECLAKFKSSARALAQELKHLAAYVQKRMSEPHVGAEPPISKSRMVESDTKFREDLGRLAAKVEERNKYVAEFAEVQASAARSLKEHHLLAAREEYDRLTNEARAFGAAMERAQRLYDTQLDRVGRVRDMLRTHGPAVDVINPLLKSYLGHEDLTIQTSGDGYSLRRRGRAMPGSLSEGERTALAFCYFISRLGEGQKKRAELVVVIDDPISSLDAKALNYAFGLVKHNCENVRQLFVLTHNVNFMNETKRWLKSRSKGKNGAAPTASLYFLEASLQPAEGEESYCRVARLVELPKLLRDYDSEYHFLVSQVIKCAAAGDAELSMSYALPNAIRKTMELFLAFRAPGPDGIEAKLSHPCVRDCGVDAVAIAALVRLSNVESHGDNLDEILTFSPMNIEETRRAAEALLQLMAAMDKDHLDRMRKLAA